MEKGIFYLICTLVILGAVAAFTVSVQKDFNSINAKLSAKPNEVVVVATPTVAPTATPAASLKFFRAVTPTRAK